MYIIDYPNQRIKKFSNNELEDFLNTIIKKRWLFVKDKKKANERQIEFESNQLNFQF